MTDNNIRKNYLKKYSEKTFFILGDEAAGYGALYAGCNFFAGYPITPASEVAELMARELPCVNGYYVQMEDEIGSISAVIGAVWAGAKGMTATSGPGFSLMQENIGYACMTETPCVILNVQRSGPSTGQATKPAQGDMMQARWGTHGDHEIIALSPNSVQETFYLMIDAFNLSEEYRNPVIVLTDGEIGHVREKIIFPDPDKIKLKERKLAKKEEHIFGGSNIPPMSELGKGQFLHITGSTHLEDGMRDVSTQKVHDVLVRRIYSKINGNRDKIVRYESKFLEDAEILLVSYGVSSRPSLGAVLRARQDGIKIGYLRLITIWPFPDKIFREFDKSNIKKILVPEMNLGQLFREIQRFVRCDVISLSRIGGVSFSVKEIYDVIKEL
ncbi:2-oxoacid:acceptor oxidoreductase subunit alpha [candidate division KSB1 bacterium]|nr:MAG: 2-oxoacid:acceptor oxidoreductase subunit alpha [candidate division KSB1 bacterium]